MLHLIQNSWKMQSKNKIPKDNIHKVTEDNILSLSISHGWNLNINDFFYYDFSIVLNETLECVGFIKLDYTLSGFSYGGNVSYYIYDTYRKHHYATRALNLLKTVASTNNFCGDKDLYIATKVDNKYSGKVAMNNGGKLIYNGPVSDNEYINYAEGIKKVKVYQIKIDTSN